MVETFGRVIGSVGGMERIGRAGELLGPASPGQTEIVDRRAAVRFPIEQEVRYRIFSGNTIETGSGHTLNVSSNGVLFTTERTLEAGERIEVAISWPAQLDNHCALKLVTGGRVIRSDGNYAAICIERYEFRTQGAQRLL